MLLLICISLQRIASRNWVQGLTRTRRRIRKMGPRVVDETRRRWQAPWVVDRPSSDAFFFIKTRFVTHSQEIFNSKMCLPYRLVNGEDPAYPNWFSLIGICVVWFGLCISLIESVAVRCISDAQLYEAVKRYMQHFYSGARYDEKSGSHI